MKNKRIKNIIISSCILCITLIFCEILYHYDIGHQNINIVMSMAIFIIAASTDGYIYGIVSAAVGVFAYDFIITSPRFAFSFTRGFPITLITMLLVVFTSSTITTNIKKQVRHAKQQHERAELLYSINRKLLSTRDIDTIARYAMEYLKNDLNRSVAFFEIATPGVTLNPYFRYVKDDEEIDYFTTEEMQNLVKLTVQRQVPLDIEGEGYFYPLVMQNITYGVFAFACNEKNFNKKQLMFLSLISEQTAQALKMYQLTFKKQEALLMVETEKIKNSFLRSISHDLRTPLTGIIGSSATILEGKEELSTDVLLKLVEGIHKDSQWLLSMIENILSITKVRKNGMLIEKKEEIVEEVVEGVVSTFHKRFPDAQIMVKHSENVILLPMDRMLISQVLINILENSQKHSKGQRSDVIVKIKEEIGFISFNIIDSGPGIDESILPNLFHYPIDSKDFYKDSTRGLGIGLYICKTIINAHGGKLYAENQPGGGARFVFTLPMSGETEYGE